MITSLSNTQIKNIILLQTKTKERRKQNSYVVEGIKMIKEVPTNQLVKLYIAESFLDRQDYNELKLGYEYEIVKDSVFERISETVTPQGILAIVKKQEYTFLDILKTTKRCVVVLESIQDPGNLGTIIRTAEGAGATVVMNKSTVDIYNPKVIRSTMGSIYRVPFMIVEDISIIISDLKENGMKVYAAHLIAEKNYYNIDYSGGAVFLIGNEGNGLTKEVAELADTYVKIPMEGKTESLNAAVAAAILMYKVGEYT